MGGIVVIVFVLIMLSAFLAGPLGLVVIGVAGLVAAGGAALGMR